MIEWVCGFICINKNCLLSEVTLSHGLLDTLLLPPDGVVNSDRW